MPKQILVTDEAYEILEASKKESNSKKLLASEAIKRVYGGKMEAAQPANGYPPAPSAAELKEQAARLLAKTGGNAARAIDMAKNQLPNDIYKDVAKAIIEMAGGGI